MELARGRRIEQSLTILISSAGRRVELMECFREAGAKMGISVRIVTVDLNPAMSAACNVADSSYAVRPCTDPGYLNDLCEVSRKENVALLIPTIDPELELMSCHAEKLAAVGVKIVVSQPNVIRLARSKLKTCRWLEANGLPVPRTMSYDDFAQNPEALSWPVIAKPDGGSSSVGIRVFHSREEWDACDLEGGSYIVQEYWKGREFTVNLFFDDEGQLRCTIPHLRVETRSGEVNKGITERNGPLMASAERLGRALEGARGPLCFQAIERTDGEHAIFEINGRFGGGYPLAHSAGAVFAQWLLEERLNIPPTYSNNWRNNLAMLRYDTSVFKEVE